MDTSKEYIKQSDCEELQSKREFDEGDFIWYRKTGIVFSMEFWSTTDNGRCLCFNDQFSGNKKDFVKLFRQDQLQEMLMDEPYPKTHAIGRLQDFTDFIHTIPYNQDNSEEDEACHYFNSMEQLWLAFVMKGKHNKTWNGEGWT